MGQVQLYRVKGQLCRGGCPPRYDHGPGHEGSHWPSTEVQRGGLATVHGLPEALTPSPRQCTEALTRQARPRLSGRGLVVSAQERLTAACCALRQHRPAAWTVTVP